jgi:2-amino-4-hydroxy-6-hydroxymethyldihydropteridine diphosphokinase
MNHAYLLLGGNTGDRVQNLATALAHITARCGTVLKTSSLYETAAWGQTDQPAFLNQAVMIRTNLAALPLLHTILDIEKEMGRTREVRYDPRNIDIDILFYNRDLIQLPGLEVPHPGIPHRRFVLAPMAEITPHKLHPALKKSMKQLLQDCTDPLPVKKWLPGH